MTQKILTLPFRLGFGAARTALEITTKTLEITTKTLDVSARLATITVETLRPGGQSATPPEPQRPTEPAPAGSEDHPEAPAPRPSPPRPPRPVARQSRPDRVNGHATAAPPDSPPVTPLTREQAVVKTLDDEDEVVAEFAEPGAEDGAGAQLEVEEPWEGYARMNAATITARIDAAGAAELALLELYEQTHKRRQTVLTAATRRLRALSPPAPATDAD